MKTKTLIFIVLASCLTFSNIRAQDTLFGEAGSGQPTATVIGILGGAALGSAIGGAAGGADAPWIGALVGSTVGGIVGNQVGAAEAHYPRYEKSYVYETRRGRHVKVCDEIPYGDIEHGRVQSPWSEFSLSVGGKTQGQVVYDANTGQPFRVP